MVRNYIKIAWRNILKNKTFSFINIMGLAIGLTCSILIFMWVHLELSYDKFHTNYKRIYRVLQDMPFTEKTTWGISQGPLARSLDDQFPEIENAASVAYGTWQIRYNKDEYEERALYSDNNFFKVFSFVFLEGDINSAISEPNSVVFTRSAAEKIFGSEDALGKTVLLYDQAEVLVTGIIEDVPGNSHMQFDVISSLELSKNFFGYTVDRWNNSQFNTYVLLNENSEPESVNNKIKDFLDDKPTLEDGAKLKLQPISEIHLSSNIDFNTGATGSKQYVVIFFSSALFILVIACINFMNLSTARAATRAREVGLRKTIGAQRYQLVYQFIMESLALAFIAFLIALILVQASLPIFSELAGQQLGRNFFQPEFILGFILLLLFTGLMAGSYPAFFLSSFSPVNVLKGGSVKTYGNTGFRRLLVVFQCIISIVLLIGTLAVYRQVNYLSNKNLGFNKDNLMYLRLVQGMPGKLETIKGEFLKNENILNAAGSGPLIGYWWSNNRWSWEGKGPENDILFRGASVDYDYYKTMGIPIIEGRSFSRDYPSDSAAVIFNETAIRQMGLKDPVGKTVTQMGDGEEYTIIGIAKDYNFRSLYSEIEPLLITLRPQWSNFLFLRLNGENVGETVKFVESKWKELSPNHEINYGFLDQRLQNLYEAESRTGAVLNAFAVLAIVILGLGLFGLLGFSMSQRYKEISIRKVFGANIRLILLLLAKDYAKLLFIAIIISIPISNYLITNWLGSFPYRTDLPYSVFLIPALILIFISLVIIIGQSYKASRINTAETLRGE